MIEWTVTTSAGGKKRKFWGETDARSDSDVTQAFREQWRKVFEDVLTWYPDSKWDTLNCGCIAYCGTFDFGPRPQFDPFGELPGCNLCFTFLRDSLRSDFSSTEVFERACGEQERRHIELFMRAWSDVKDDAAIRVILKTRAIPFSLANKPDADPDYVPLLEFNLQ